MGSPLVSVLMSSYNHAIYVEAAVRSVMAQEGTDFEFLVVDDGSTDGSAEILKALQAELGFQLWVRENRGLVNSLNELAEKSRGALICSIASDDIFPQGRLALQVAYMQENPNCIASFGQICTMDKAGVVSQEPDPRYLSGVPQVTFEQLLLGVRELQGCTEMIRKDAFMKVGGYPVGFRFEDYPLWLRLSRTFGPLSVLPSVHCYYRIHGENSHRKLDYIYEEVLRILREHQDHKLYPEAVRRWKANWFSSWAYENKWEAILHLPRCFSFSRHFLRRLPKLFIPRMFLRY